MSDVTDLAGDERADLLALARTLTPAQWDAPTLCSAWSVRDVVAHVLSYEELSPLELGVRLARGVTLNRTNALGVAGAGGPDELIALLERSSRPRGLTARFGGRIALVDGMIHQQDIRRPLGLPREIPPERLVPALEFAYFSPTTGAAWRARGLRLTATDVGWARGRGAEVRGRGEALLLAMTGRGGVAAELDGPGQPTLAARTG